MIRKIMELAAHKIAIKKKAYQFPIPKILKNFVFEFISTRKSINETIRTQGLCDFKNSGSLWSLGTVYSGSLSQVLGVHSRYNTHTHTQNLTPCPLATGTWGFQLGLATWMLSLGTLNLE